MRRYLFPFRSSTFLRRTKGETMAAPYTLHVDRNVTISIKTKDWTQEGAAGKPMVGFQLRIGNMHIGGVAAANSDGQTVTCTLKVPQIHNAGHGPWPSELRIAYCIGMNPADGAFMGLAPHELPQPIAAGQVSL
jgi:hypothetical protein